MVQGEGESGPRSETKPFQLQIKPYRYTFCRATSTERSLYETRVAKLKAMKQRKWWIAWFPLTAWTKPFADFYQSFKRRNSSPKWFNQQSRWAPFARLIDPSIPKHLSVFVYSGTVQHSRGQSVLGERGSFQSALQGRYWFQVRWCRSAWTYDRRSIDITMPVQTVCSRKSRLGWRGPLALQLCLCSAIR